MSETQSDLLGDDDEVTYTDSSTFLKVCFYLRILLLFSFQNLMFFFILTQTRELKARIRITIIANTLWTPVNGLKILFETSV